MNNFTARDICLIKAEKDYWNQIYYIRSLSLTIQRKEEKQANKTWKKRREHIYNTINPIPIIIGHKLNECNIIEPTFKGINKRALIDTKPIEGICYFCSELHTLNEEHLPALSSGNVDWVIALSGNELINAYTSKIIDFTKLTPDIRINNDCCAYKHGVFVRRLCDKCNGSRNYINDYSDICNITRDTLSNNIKNNIHHINLSIPQNNFIGFVKQILSMFLINCSQTFYQNHKRDIVNYIMNRRNKDFFLPPNFNLWMGVYSGPLARRVGIKSIISPLLPLALYGEISFSPFIFVLASSDMKSKSLLKINSFIEQKEQNLPIIDFRLYDITNDFGFDYENDLTLEGYCRAQDILYYRKSF